MIDVCIFAVLKAQVHEVNLLNRLACFSNALPMGKLFLEDCF